VGEIGGFQAKFNRYSSTVHNYSH